VLYFTSIDCWGETSNVQLLLCTYCTIATMSFALQGGHSSRYPLKSLQTVSMSMWYMCVFMCVCTWIRLIISNVHADALLPNLYAHNPFACMRACVYCVSSCPCVCLRFTAQEFMYCNPPRLSRVNSSRLRTYMHLHVTCIDVAYVDTYTWNSHICDHARHTCTNIRA
jgi:hypothetical protein